jgi:nucleotide-binding universal stress UspA family protein
MVLPARVLLATDFGPNTQALTDLATALTEPDRSVEVVIVHGLSSESEAEAFVRTEAACRALGRRVRAGGGRVSSTVVIRYDAPEDLIMKSARELEAALILLGWSKDSLGTTARALLRCPPAPLLFVGSEWRSPEIPAGGLLERARALSTEQLDLRELLPLARLDQGIAQIEAAPAESAFLVFADVAGQPLRT